MEIIDWIEEDNKGRENLVAYCLIEAMGRKAGRDVITEVFEPFKPEALEVEFKINGVEVPFTWVCGIIQKHLDDIESEVKKKLRHDVLSKIQNEINNIMYEEGAWD